MNSRTWMTVAAAAIASACATPPRAVSAPPDSPKPSATASAHSAAADDLAALRALAPVQAALANAARVAGLAADQLVLESVERVTWRDGSLGCPEPDLMYTQMLVPGLRIRITAGKRALDYHSGLQGEPVLCPPGRSVDPVMGAR